jgi:hypothetical protein
MFVKNSTMAFRFSTLVVTFAPLKLEKSFWFLFFDDVSR